MCLTTSTGRVVGGRCEAQYVPDNVHQLHVQTTFHVWKTRGCHCSFRLLMMGDVSPETCWASYEHGIIKFWYTVASCWIFLYELHYIIHTFNWRLFWVQGFINLNMVNMRPSCNLAPGNYLNSRASIHTSGWSEKKKKVWTCMYSHC